MTTAQLKTNKGFTLIELLVVIGILAVLLAITLIAINPAKQFAQANDTKRRSDVNAILNAVNQYAADNKGNITALAIPESPAAADNIADDGVDMCALLVPEYLAALPVDPLTDNGQQVEAAGCGDYDTNYFIVQSSTDSRITVSAPATEIDAVDISVTR